MRLGYHKLFHIKSLLWQNFLKFQKHLGFDFLQPGNVLIREIEIKGYESELIMPLIIKSFCENILSCTNNC